MESRQRTELEAGQPVAQLRYMAARRSRRFLPASIWRRLSSRHPASSGGEAVV